MKREVTVTIHVSGGCVQDVEIPEDPDVEIKYRLLDYDNEPYLEDMITFREFVKLHPELRDIEYREQAFSDVIAEYGYEPYSDDPTEYDYEYNDFKAYYNIELIPINKVSVLHPKRNTR